MRLLPGLLAAALLAAPASAEKLGARTAAPHQVLGEMAPADPLAEADAIAAAAAAHPLGTVENPVRVGGPQGARAYIARLRCADGSRPAVWTRTVAWPIQVTRISRPSIRRGGTVGATGT